MSGASGGAGVGGGGGSGAGGPSVVPTSPFSTDPMCKVRSGGKETKAVMGGRLVRTVAYPDGVEMAEEYGTDGVLAARKWRTKGVLRGVSGAPSADGWVWEFGEPPAGSAADAGAAGAGGASTATTAAAEVRESSATPFLVRTNKAAAWEFKFRNLPYPLEVYNVTADAETQQLVLRTSNRKYFKRFHIPALIRAGKSVSQAAVTLSHDGVNTLTVAYAKPDEVLAAEAADTAALSRWRAEARDGDVSCKPQ